jgi:hypothetical protein
VRGLVFEPPHVREGEPEPQDVVQLHLEHRLVKRLLSRFLSQGFRATVGRITAIVSSRRSAAHRPPGAALPFWPGGAQAPRGDHSCHRGVARHAQRGQPPDTICGFKRGTLFRAALDVLRTTTAPMTVTEIAGAMLAAKGVKDATAKQRKGIEAGVRCSLENNASKGVERVGEGVPKRWKLAG